jgi:hypothetical protein
MKRLLSLLVLAACIDPAEPALDGPDAGEELSQTEQAASGGTAVTAPGFVGYRVGTSTTDRSGWLISPRLMLTSSRWITQGVTAPSSIVVRHDDRNSSGLVTQTRVGRWVNFHPNLPLAIVTLDSDFTNIFTPLTPASSAVPGSGINLVCRAVDNPGLAELTHVTTSSSSNGWIDYNAAFDPISPDAMNAYNAGAGCVQTDSNGVATVAAIHECVENTATSAVECSPSATGRLIATQPLADWFDDMIWLAQVRSRSGTQAYAIHPVPASGQPWRCWDIQWGGLGNHFLLQQYTCHGAGNQWFYADYDGDLTHARLVSAQSGKCIDVPGGIMNAGTALQQYKCHRRAAAMEQNQRFDIPNPVPGNSSSWRGTFRPRGTSNVCLGVRGAPTSNAALIEIQSCRADGVGQIMALATGLAVDTGE